MVTNYRPRGGQKWENRYAYDTVSENADEAEWSAVVNGSAHLSIGVTDQMMAESGEEFVPVRTLDDPLQGREMVQESLQGTVAELLLERQRLLGDAYPFSIDGNTLSYQPVDDLLYVTLLGICQAPSLSAAPYNTLAQLFENLSVMAGRSYLGASTKGYRSGWPRPDGEAQRFRALVSSIKTLTGNHLGEWYWRPNEDLPDDPTSRNIKEGGLDIVVWKPWSDQRTGQLYLLGQCACGKDWLEKFKDLETDRLKNWCTLSHAAPLRSFFTPRFAVAALLSEASQEAGLVFDRIRMVQTLRSDPMALEVAAMSVELRNCIAIAQRPMEDAPA